ncbi:Iron-sulfur protein NUBPL, partial [Cucurbita argyrosperma subsp. argyrosperma]
MEAEFSDCLSRVGGVRGYSASKKELKIDGIKHTIAIASGKGGVGKSTTADRKMVPVESYGVKCMSMGLLVENNAALVWRGPMINGAVPWATAVKECGYSRGNALVDPLVNLKFKRISTILLCTKTQGNHSSRVTLPLALTLVVSSALEKMTRGVAWGDLDILVVDMPPGTGDVQITMSQRLLLSGALIVSTPQDVALMDARRGIKMFSNVHVPILGIVENMSYFTCPHCDERSYIFGRGGSRKAADEMGIPFVGEVPLEEKNRKGCDEGVPIVMSEPNSLVSTKYVEIAEKVMERIEEVERQKLLYPKIQL